MAPFPFKVYLIGDRRQVPKQGFSKVIREAAEGGIRILQFREKDLSHRMQYELAMEITQTAKNYGMHVLINGRIDLCLALNADGVQLPIDGFPVGMARKLLGKHKWIGLSCHNEEDLKRAERKGADFALLGPVYDTPSKRHYGSPLGLDYFRRVKKNAGIPVLAIGGVNLNRLKEVFDAGADGVAMISGIISNKNIKSQCQKIHQVIATLSKN